MSDTALSLHEVLKEERAALAGKPLVAGPAVSSGGTTSGQSQLRGSAELPSDAPVGAVDSSESNSAAENRDVPEADVYRCLNDDNRWALCLSGGGVRSATFALGILQRFAAQPSPPKLAEDQGGSLLQQFEYLSTVSGGGYIGSWLSAWLFQERQARAARGHNGGGANAVVAALARRQSDHSEVEPISNLRRDSHYLAPSFSAISPDLWSDIAGVVRNLALNWILLVPPMILAVLATKALAYCLIDALSLGNGSLWFIGIMLAAMVCFAIALSFAVANRPTRGLINASQSQFLIYDMAIFLIGATLLIFILGSKPGQQFLKGIVSGLGVSHNDSISLVLLRGCVLGIIIYSISWLAAPSWKWILRQPPQLRIESTSWHAWVDFITWCVAGSVFGVLVAAGYLIVFNLYETQSSQPIVTMAIVAVCGLPWILAARGIADVVFIAFAEFLPGADASLEYQARSGGIFLLSQLGWLIWFGLVLLAPGFDQKVAGQITSLFAVGGISGAFSVIVGASSKTKAILQPATGLRRYLTLNTLAAIAAAIFGAALVAILSLFVNWAFEFEPLWHVDGEPHPPWTLVAVAALLLTAVVVAASLVISVNRYSLHSIYRNRLVRAFLGASRDQQVRYKSKNHFTDFDSFDSPLLHQLWEPEVKPRGDDWKPLHIVNAAMNLVSSKNLAWQERMAAPFTFSALHCGSGSSIFPDGAYRKTFPPPGQGRPYGARLGLTLGTAMAVSGAAVSPNMGYNTSPGVAFLMALFNVRLGWWLANPRGDNPDYWRIKPPMALRPYFMEMFGLTSETERWVYLSDGGHFENLGLYEMVRRRCRIIVVSDASCDPDYKFDDLGNALRKIWIDLGVRIDISGLDRLKKRFKERPTPAKKGPYWAVGRIRYNDADGGGKDGWLLYFKSGLHGTEPMDVLSYAMTHAAFPHETTANQFFTESQFESYRRLGFEIADQAFEAGGSTTVSLALDKIIERLDEQLAAEEGSCRTNPNGEKHGRKKRATTPPRIESLVCDTGVTLR